jgi:hypothetical protein
MSRTPSSAIPSRAVSYCDDMRYKSSQPAIPSSPPAASRGTKRPASPVSGGTTATDHHLRIAVYELRDCTQRLPDIFTIDGDGEERDYIEGYLFRYLTTLAVACGCDELASGERNPVFTLPALRRLGEGVKSLTVDEQKHLISYLEHCWYAPDLDREYIGTREEYSDDSVTKKKTHEGTYRVYKASALPAQIISKLNFPRLAVLHDVRGRNKLLIDFEATEAQRKAKSDGQPVRAL